MAAQIQLEVVSPERLLVSEAVDMVTVPALGGEIGVLPGHAPLISQLRTGILGYTQGGAVRRLHVSEGFVEVASDRVSVLAEVAERPEEVDSTRAKQEREQAEGVLKSLRSTPEETAAAQIELDRAVTRLELLQLSS